MKKLPIALAFAVLLAACGKEGADQAAQTAPAAPPAPKAAAPLDQPATPTRRRAPAALIGAKLDTVIAGSWRSDKNKARDQYRHPKETLEFFGVKPGDTLIEITPGGGWYTEILAPLMKGSGTYVAAVAQAEEARRRGRAGSIGPPEEVRRRSDRIRRSEDRRVRRRGAELRSGGIGRHGRLRSATCTTGRRRGTAPQMFKAFFDVLKPGGVLGVVDHRAADGADVEKIEGHGLPADRLRDQARDRCRFQAQGAERDQRESEGHQGLREGRLDAAADLRARRQGSRQVRRDRRVRPHDAEVRQGGTATRSSIRATIRAATDRVAFVESSRLMPAEDGRGAAVSIRPAHADPVQQAVRRALPVHRPQRSAEADARRIHPRAGRLSGRTARLRFRRPRRADRRRRARAPAHRSAHKLAKTYLVQVEGTPDEAALRTAARAASCSTTARRCRPKPRRSQARRHGSGRAIRRCAFARTCPMRGCGSRSAKAAIARCVA